MPFVDSHCHLDDKQFDADRSAVLERARHAGLKWMLAIGTGDGPPDLRAALRLAEQHSFVYATVGIHPNDAEKAEEQTFSELQTLLRHPKVVAIGEIGLDYHWQVPVETQLPVFTKQLALAQNARKPIVIHTRDAWDDTLDILRAEWAGTGLPCILHCFSGTAEQARSALDLGFFLAFGGVTTFPKNSELREAARITPLDRLLIETDCPYLAPVPHRGKRNEPAYVIHTAKAIANVKGITPEELGVASTAAFEKAFGLSSYTEDSPH